MHWPLATRISKFLKRWPSRWAVVFCIGVSDEDQGSPGRVQVLGVAQPTNWQFVHHMPILQSAQLHPSQWWWRLAKRISWSTKVKSASQVRVSTEQLLVESQSLFAHDLVTINPADIRCSTPIREHKECLCLLCSTLVQLIIQLWYK